MNLDKDGLLKDARHRFMELFTDRRISFMEFFDCVDPITHELDPVTFPPCRSELDRQAKFKTLVEGFMLRRGWDLEGAGPVLVDALCAEIWEFQREWNPSPSSGPWEEVARKLETR